MSLVSCHFPCINPMVTAQRHIILHLDVVPDVEVIWQCLSPTQSRPDERKSDGSRHWESIKSVLVRKFAREEARDFSDKNEDGILKSFTSDSRALRRYSN